ncbi:MAG: HEPN domain-containing protein [Tunicatimonas sp.]
MKEEERQALVQYRINKAKETFEEIATLSEHRFWNTAVNRMYYACYYAVSALLIDRNIQVQTHTGARRMFGLHFIKTGVIDQELGKFYSSLFNKRQTGDYEDFLDHDQEDVEALIKPARSLIDTIEALLTK